MISNLQNLVNNFFISTIVIMIATFISFKDSTFIHIKQQIDYLHDIESLQIHYNTENQGSANMQLLQRRFDLWRITRTLRNPHNQSWFSQVTFLDSSSIKDMLTRCNEDFSPLENKLSPINFPYFKQQFDQNQDLKALDQIRSYDFENHGPVSMQLLQRRFDLWRITRTMRNPHNQSWFSQITLLDDSAKIKDNPPLFRNEDYSPKNELVSTRFPLLMSIFVISTSKPGI